MADELINPTDFKSIQLKISITNTTKKVEIKRTSAIKLVELHEQGLQRGLTLEVPAKSCEKGHYLVMKIEAIVPGPKSVHDDGGVPFKTGAKVEEIRTLGPMDQIRVSLLQHDKEAWEKFCGLFSSRQEEIEKFFTAVRGY